MSEEQEGFVSSKSPRGYSPRPVTITVPPGQEVRIVQGSELKIVFSDGSTTRPGVIDGGPGDSTSPQRK